MHFFSIDFIMHHSLFIRKGINVVTIRLSKITFPVFILLNVLHPIYCACVQMRFG